MKPESAAQHLPFPLEEYHQRRARVRASMAAHGIDQLYVTSPANLCYLTGYEAIWYPSRLPLGAVLERSQPAVTFFEWTRHEGYICTRVLCDEVVLIDYGRASGEVADAFAQRGWTRTVTGIEWGSPHPAAPIMTALAQQLRELGATLMAADFLVDQLRLYKSPAEVERVRRAAGIADQALRALQRELVPGMSELEVSARLTSLLAERGSEVAAMVPLVNSGPTAWQDTHAFPSARRIQSGDVVAIDCCAVIDRYHANLGRTFAVGPPNARAARLLELAAGSIEALTRTARVGEGPESAAAAASRYVRERIPAQNIWWVGGYALGLAFPPSWVGHTYLGNDGIQKCSLLPGYVSNYENVLLDREQGFEAASIDTLVVTERGLEVLSSLPRGLLPAGE